jgi:hypothetical protein
MMRCIRLAQSPYCWFFFYNLREAERWRNRYHPKPKPAATDSNRTTKLEGSPAHPY